MATNTNIDLEGKRTPQTENVRGMDVNLAGVNGFFVPANKTQNITASDVTVYDPVIKAFRVGSTAGDVAVVDFEDNTVTIPNVQVGERIDGLYKQILATGTTATGITAFI